MKSKPGMKGLAAATRKILSHLGLGFREQIKGTYVHAQYGFEFFRCWEGFVDESEELNMLPDRISPGKWEGVFYSVAIHR